MLAGARLPKVSIRNGRPPSASRYCAIVSGVAAPGSGGGKALRRLTWSVASEKARASSGWVSGGVCSNAVATSITLVGSGTR
jgi:hypothetical protein